MKLKNIATVRNAILWAFLCVAAGACSDDPVSTGEHDPNQPVEILDFRPKTGGARTRLYIQGKNFGTDISQIHVKVGGTAAKVIGSDGEWIYCIISPKSYNGNKVEVAVGQDEEYVAGETPFDYKISRQVKTLCGYVDEYGKTEANDGSFDVAGFANPEWLVADPKNPHLIYMVDNREVIRVIDTEKEEVYRLLSKGQAQLYSIREITFTKTGDTLSMYVDYDDLLAASATGKRELATRHVEYMGAQAPACYLLNALSPSISLDYDKLNQAITTLTPQQFGEQMEAQRTQWLHIADSVVDACRLPEKAVRMLHNKAMVKAGTGLLDFVMYREYSAQQDTANLVLKAPVEDSYYNFIKEMPLDDETLPADEGFSIFINRLEYMRPLSNITMEESRAASKLFRQWSDEGILTQEKADSLFAASEQNTERRKAAYLKQLFGSKVPFCWEIAELRSYCSSLKYASTSQEVEHYTNQTRQMLTSPVLLAEMERMHQEASSEESSYMLPEGKATEVFRNIVGKYKGKVVFVDFWATTCGPCRSGIEHTVDLRKQYKGHPEFQFVYITNEEESPQKDYDEYVEKNLKGEACYRIPNSDYHYLRQLFRFNGIPHYVLVEKDGSISRKNVEAYQLEQYLKERFE